MKLEPLEILNFTCNACNVNRWVHLDDNGDANDRHVYLDDVIFEIDGHDTYDYLPCGNPNYGILLSYMLIAICSLDNPDEQIVAYAKEINDIKYPMALWRVALIRAIDDNDCEMPLTTLVDLLEPFTSKHPWVVVPKPGEIRFLDDPDKVMDLETTIHAPVPGVYDTAVFASHEERETFAARLLDYHPHVYDTYTPCTPPLLITQGYFHKSKNKVISYVGLVPNKAPEVFRQCVLSEMWEHWNRP